MQSNEYAALEYYWDLRTRVPWFAVACTVALVAFGLLFAHYYH